MSLCNCCVKEYRCPGGVRRVTEAAGRCPDLVQRQERYEAHGSAMSTIVQGEAKGWRVVFTSKMAGELGKAEYMLPYSEHCPKGADLNGPVGEWMPLGELVADLARQEGKLLSATVEA